MDKLISETLTRVPGLVLGLSVKGERTVNAYGNRQVFGVGSPLPMTVDTSFDAGSITKILATTSALMRLVESDEISLNQRASTFLPAWVGREKEAITLRDLLLHRGGLWEWRPLYIAFRDSTEIAKKIASIPLRYPVNQDRHYSDLGFISLGQILICLTGEELSDSIDKLVCEPLGMNKTQYATPHPGTPIAATSLGDRIEREMVISKGPFPVPEEASEFTKWRTHVLVGEVNDGNAFHLFGGISGHAGLFTNAEDLLIFGESMNSSMRGEGSYSQKVLSEFLETGPDTGQQLGFRSWFDTYEGCTSQFFGHTGFPGVVLAFSPSHDSVATLLTNRLHVEGEIPATELLWQPFLRAIHKKIHE
ncbi:MAG: beta-lactamase family protein [Actinobacteria bacterium]|nr:beta-lactamase family protein [Actinomycetota bacterium]